MSFARFGACVILSCVLGMGCASDEERSLRQLSRQQAATVQSLSDEVEKLNLELNGAIQSREDLKSALPRFERLLGSEIARGDCRVSLKREGLVITLFQRALFNFEDGRLLSSAEDSLSKISGAISSDLPRHSVAIEGHTDDRPVEGPEGTTNWEYSTDCAAVVLRYFVDAKGLRPERFRVSGFGEFRPIASNATEEGRWQNRRVEIVILP